MKLSLATKIFLGFSLVLTVFGTVPVFGLIKLNAIREQINTVNRALLPLNRLVAEIETQQETARRSIDSILRFDDITLQRSLLQNNRRAFLRSMNSRLQRAAGVLGRIPRQALSEREARFVEDIEARFERLGDLTAEFDASIRWILQSLEIQPASADDLTGLRRTGRRLAREVRVIKLKLKNMVTTQMLMIEQDESSAIGVLIWLTILAIAVGVLVTVFSLLALRPIRRLAAAARRISEGDFSPTVEITSTDEFGFLTGEFNRMARSLRQREDQLVRQQAQLAEVNRELRQSSIDLALVKLYNEHIIRSMPNGVLVADRRRVVTTINPAAERMWFLEPQQVEGRRIEELTIGEALGELLAAWDRVLRDQERLLFEALEFEHPERGQVMVDLHVSPLLGTGDDVQGVLIVGEDVTEKVRTKQALIQSERLATIGRMSAVVAHEIRNPLSSIGLNSEMLQDELEDGGPEALAESRSLLGSIAREVERLTEVTDEYLRFARLPDPNLHPENINSLLDDLLEFMAGEFDRAGVEIERELDPALAPVAADEAQLRQAFLNLLKNSTESMAEGGVLTVRSRQDDGLVRITVADTGKGIDAESLERVFEPFFSTRSGGTGLGLSLTQQIVQEHGGDIRCQSAPERGTAFEIELPACPRDTAEG